MPNWSCVTYICSSPSFSVRDLSLGTHFKGDLIPVSWRVLQRCIWSHVEEAERLEMKC